MNFDPAAPYPPLTALSDAIQLGAARPSEVAAAHLSRIEQLDPVIGAYQAVYSDDAMAAAEAADKAIASGARIGPFHGIPFALKDIVDVEGRITTGGSLAMKDRVSPATGALARRLIAAGGVLLGKTKTVECALGGWGTNQHMGTPRNPWDLDVHRIPGGSSAGSGAAVAAGLAVCAVGTDTGGSVRLPSAFCGLTGIKITERRLPTDGIIPLSTTLDTPGPMARSVEDAILMFETMDGREGWAIERDRSAGKGLYGVSRMGISGLRLGVLDRSERDACDAEVLAAYDAALDLLRGLGAVLTEFTWPFGNAELTAASGRLIAAEGYAEHGEMYEDPSKPMDEDVRTRMLAGRDISAADFIALLTERRERQTVFRELMQGYDALLTPCMTQTAPPLSEVDQAISPAHFTRGVNYLALCAACTPSGLTPAGLPTSLQIIARGGQEAMALRVAGAFEQACQPIGHPELPA